MTTSKPPRRRALPPKPADRYHHGDLRAALLTSARLLLGEKGPEALSLRDVARRLGVSHNAPYKHFASRDALLADLAAEGFRELAARNAAAAGAATPDRAMAERGVAYVAYALDNPSVFRLMFSPMLDKAAFPALREASQASFAALGATTAAVAGTTPPAAAPSSPLLAWAMVHGLASLLLDGQIAIPAGASPLDVVRATLGASSPRPD